VTHSSEARRYAEAGVDLATAETAKERIGRAVASTRTTLSAGEVGAFGGMVRIPAGMRHPTLVMSTDGVGTKVLVAQQAGRYDTVGECLVNHSVNDILVHGARPIAFMDYIAGAGLTVEVLAAIVEGVARVVGPTRWRWPGRDGSDARSLPARPLIRGDDCRRGGGGRSPARRPRGCGRCAHRVCVHRPPHQRMPVPLSPTLHLMSPTCCPGSA
jgi:hypothetical protein